MRFQHLHRRRAFTLPELMVAAAMSLTIMAIIAVAFQRGIQSFRTLRAVGNMQDRLRSAQNVIKRDLSAEHFGGNFQQGYSGPYVRDQRLDLIGWQPPEEGYFEFRELAPSAQEGVDSDGIPSFRAGSTEAQSLRFTSKLTGKRQEDWFYAYANGTTFPTAVWNQRDADFSSATNSANAFLATRWAEIAYFLEATPDSAGTTPLFSLRRRERPLLGSASGSFQSPSSVARAANRFGGAGFAYTADPNGDDILLTDVISFEIKLNWSSSGIAEMANTSPGLPASTTALDWPFANPTASLGMRFDTGSRLDVQTSSPNYNWNDPASYDTGPTGAPRFRVRLNTVQIRIRIWDRNTDTARQITIVQDV